MADIVNRYPVGGTFENIREGKYLYIDKTRYIIDSQERHEACPHAFLLCGRPSLCDLQEVPGRTESKRVFVFCDKYHGF